MDVTCSNCREPWDYYHMLHDEVWETDLSEFEKKKFTGKLDPTYRMAFEKLGWRFGNGILNIRHCPACKESEHPDRVTRDPLGDDLDAIASFNEDYRL